MTRAMENPVFLALQFIITYVVSTHWNCIKEAIPMCTYNTCLFKNMFGLNVFYLYILYIEQQIKANNNIG